jgi:hypothetical protein
LSFVYNFSSQEVDGDKVVAHDFNDLAKVLALLLQLRRLCRACLCPFVFLSIALSFPSLAALVYRMTRTLRIKRPTTTLRLVAHRRHRRVPNSLGRIECL